MLMNKDDQNQQKLNMEKIYSMILSNVSDIIFIPKFWVNKSSDLLLSLSVYIHTYTYTYITYMYICIYIKLYMYTSRYIYIAYIF